jgi:hypothetical protein
MFLLFGFIVTSRADDTKGEIKPETKTRLLQVGDRWTYKFTTKYPYTDHLRIGNASIPISKNLEFSGTLDVKVIRIVAGNGPTELAFMKNLKFRRNDKDVDRTWVVYFEQDEQTREVSEFRKAEDVDAKSKAGCLVPGDWGEGLSYENRPLFGVSPRFNSHLAETEVAKPNYDEFFNSVVTGAEKVRVKAGTFSAWKVSRTYNLPTDVVSDNVWFAPEVGYFVKMVCSTPTGDANFPKCTEIVELVSTTVPIVKPRDK